MGESEGAGQHLLLPGAAAHPVLRPEQPLSEALKLTNKAVVEALDGLPAVKIHCSVLAEQAIKAAVKDYYDKNNISYNPADFEFEDHHH